MARRRLHPNKSTKTMDFSPFASKFTEMRMLTAALFLTVAACQADTGPYAPNRERVPEPAREFRAAWIATVWNIDWPSRPGLTASQQRSELTALLDMAANLKLNAIVFQVRPGCDALYASKIEPWSHWLTGKQGRAPSDGYDPLDFAVREAHRRGMELHAWFNPYRARANLKVSAAASHISRTHPQYLMPAGTQIWLNPGHKAVQDRAVQVMADVTRRYDVDGIHIDDYFYPYPKGNKILFDDSKAYQAYRGKGGKLGLTDWRRDNVNTLVQRLNHEVKSAKPHVKFGISPFGIWRPGVPRTIEAGIDAYEDMAADSRRWLREGWVDYLSPQLYWRINQKPQSFTTLIKWWAGENKRDRHLWPGVATSRIKSSTDRNRGSREIVAQIAETRRHAATKAGTGHVHWSMKALQQDRDGIRKQLAAASYTQRALVPESPWLGGKTPKEPVVATRLTGDGVALAWPAASAGAVRWWVVQTRAPGSKTWRTERILPATATQLTLRGRPEALAVRAVSPTGKISGAKALKLQ